MSELVVDAHTWTYWGLELLLCMAQFTADWMHSICLFQLKCFWSKKSLRAKSIILVSCPDLKSFELFMLLQSKGEYQNKKCRENQLN